MGPVRFLPNPITKRQMGRRRAPAARGASPLAGRGSDDGAPASVTPNIPTVGSIEPCIQKNAGTTAAFNYFVDITGDEVHPSDNLEGWQFDLNFDPNLVQVIA